MTESKSYKWFLDSLSPFEGHLHGIRTIVYAKQTPYQHLEIIDTVSYGRCLVLDGKMQSSEGDEFIYHEALVHPAMLTHPAPASALIVGGGEGATLREVLCYPSVKKALMVDIDQEVVETCKQYLPQWQQGAMDDPRAQILFLDARRYLEETHARYDVMIIDLSEPIEEGPAYLLYTKEFYLLVTERLSEEGILALQAGTTAAHTLLNFSAVYQTLRQAFPLVVGYQAYVPSFGLPWGFMLASKRWDPRALTPKEVNRRIAERVERELQYYDGEVHQGQFLLPKHIRMKMQQEERIIEDNRPLFTYH